MCSIYDTPQEIDIDMKNKILKKTDKCISKPKYPTGRYVVKCYDDLINENVVPNEHYFFGRPGTFLNVSCIDECVEKCNNEDMCHGFSWYKPPYHNRNDNCKLLGFNPRNNIDTLRPVNKTIYHYAKKVFGQELSEEESIDITDVDSTKISKLISSLSSLIDGKKTILTKPISKISIHKKSVPYTYKSQVIKHKPSYSKYIVIFGIIAFVIIILIIKRN
tara:strand:+ start:52 stop:708 length:657 start_codon:yes stop_codon:yes gene_type:complete